MNRREKYLFLSNTDPESLFLLLICLFFVMFYLLAQSLREVSHCYADSESQLGNMVSPQTVDPPGLTSF